MQSVRIRSQAGWGVVWRARAAAGVIAAVGILVTSCRDATAPLQEEGVPAEFEFAIGAIGEGASMVQLRGDTLVLRRGMGDWSPGQAVDSVRVVPSQAQWRDFWAAADRAGVQSWQRRYVAHGVPDGITWAVRIVAGERQLESSGSNAYPDREGRMREMQMTEEFRTLISALDVLFGASVWF